MARLLDTINTLGVDVSSRTEVASYLYPTSNQNPADINARVYLGSSSKPIAGDALYDIEISIGSRTLRPSISVSVPYGEIQSGLILTDIVLLPGETLNLDLLGDPLDTDIDVCTVITDVSPDILLGNGPLPVNHDFGSIDALQYNTEYGAPIADARIAIYTKVNFDAGNRDSQYVVGQTLTDQDGRWRNIIMLEPDTYVIVFSKSPNIGPDLVEITVE